MFVTNGVLGLQALRKFPAMVFMEEEQQIWSAISWPSTLAEVLNKSIEMDKAERELIVVAF